MNDNVLYCARMGLKKAVDRDFGRLAVYRMQLSPVVPLKSGAFDGSLQHHLVEVLL